MMKPCNVTSAFIQHQKICRLVQKSHECFHCGEDQGTLFIWCEHIFLVSISLQTFLVPCFGKFVLQNCCCLFQSEFLDCLFCRDKWRSLELGKRKQKSLALAWHLLNWYALVGEHIVVTIGENVIVAWWYLWEYCTGCGNSDRMRKETE